MPAPSGRGACQHRNFSVAALHLGLAQSTVSHAIAALENHLGIVLVARDRPRITSGFKLTWQH
nr:LysR family transcriptional regulator [Romeria gracilis]